MPLEEELAAVGPVVAGLKERIADLEQLILEFEAYMESHYPYTYRNDPYCILLHERINELGIVRVGERHE